jgi:hypothetical protein
MAQDDRLMSVRAESTVVFGLGLEMVYSALILVVSLVIVSPQVSLEHMTDDEYFD